MFSIKKNEELSLLKWESLQKILSENNRQYLQQFVIELKFLKIACICIRKPGRRDKKLLKLLKIAPIGD